MILYNIELAAKKRAKPKAKARSKAKAKPKARTKSKAKSKAKSKTKSKTRSKKSGAKKRRAFGGYAISFAGRRETAEQIFGKKPIPPSEMTKKIWAFVKSKKLSNQ